MASSKINFMLRLPRSLRSRIHCYAAEEGIKKLQVDSDATFSSINYVNDILREHCSLPAPTFESNVKDPNQVVGLTLQMDPDLFLAAKNKAITSNMSLNQLILYAIEKKLEKSGPLITPASTTNQNKIINETKPKHRFRRVY